MVFPEAFELNDLLTSLRDRKDKFIILARYRDGPLYTLDLGKCYSFLARLGKTISMQTGSSLRNFIDHFFFECQCFRLAGLCGRLHIYYRCSSEYRSRLVLLKDLDLTSFGQAVLLRWNTQSSRTSFDMERRQ